MMTPRTLLMMTCLAACSDVTSDVDTHDTQEGGVRCLMGCSSDAASAVDAPIIHGGPGCGFDAAAFCDTFTTPSATKGRAGELDPQMWAVGRTATQLPTGNGNATGIASGPAPNCRANVPAEVLPDQDFLICDPGTDIASNHLLVVTAAQNYGQNSMRIRQPFDFAGRTGKISFDATAFMTQLLGWISVDVTEDPVNAPSYQNLLNDEGGSIPKNGFEVQFANNCAGWAPPPAVAVSFVETYTNYQNTQLSPMTPTCIGTQDGKLNHFEIDVSQSKIDVYLSPISTDGTKFDAPKLIYSTPVNLTFSRGYVHLTSHNHATVKYSPNNAMEAWHTRFDNVGFDGPLISNWREYEVADALTPGKDAWNRAGVPNVSVGYRIADAKDGPSQTLKLHGVDLTNLTAARLSASIWYQCDSADLPPANFDMQYRLNGHAWHDRPLTAEELADLTGGKSQGQMDEMIDVDPSELVAGDNTLEFEAKNIPEGYPPMISNIDLVITTK